MKRIKCQSEEYIFNDIAYTPEFVGYPTLSDINTLSEMLAFRNPERRFYCVSI
jgi:hypothetical protein